MPRFNLKLISLLFSITFFFASMGYGQIKYFKRYSSMESSLNFNSISVLHDSTYLLVGQEFGPNGGNYFILKTDSNGNEIWRSANKLFDGDNNSNNLTSGIELENASVILCGQISSNSSSRSNSQFYIVKVDSLGQKVWERIFGSDKNEAFSNMQIQDSCFLFVGSRWKAPQSELVLMKTKANGDSLWEKTYNFKPYSVKAKFICPNGSNLLIVGTITDTLSFYRRSILLNINESGEMISNYIISDTINNSVLNCQSINGKINVTTQNSSSSCSYSLIIRLDSNLVEIERNRVSTLSCAFFFPNNILIGTTPSLNLLIYRLSGELLGNELFDVEFGAVNDINIDSKRNIVCIGSIKEDQTSSGVGFFLKAKALISAGKLIKDHNNK